MGSLVEGTMILRIQTLNPKPLSLQPKASVDVIQALLDRRADPNDMTTKRRVKVGGL